MEYAYFKKQSNRTIKNKYFVSDDNILSELDVLLYVYDNYKDKNYDLLDDFIKFVKKWRDKNDYKTKRNI